MQSDGNIYIIAAPSGAGKTSLVNALVKKVKDIEVSISFTTRAKRNGEKHGVDYFFIEHDQFDRMIKEHAFIEYAQVFDQYYGTSLQFVENKLKQGIDIILEIDWQGARQILTHYQQAITIFILPPSRETLKNRLIARAQDDSKTIERRWIEARNEMSHFHEFDYLLINDNFDKTLSELIGLIISKRIRTQRQIKKQAKLLSNLL